MYQFKKTLALSLAKRKKTKGSSDMKLLDDLKIYRAKATALIWTNIFWLGFKFKRFIE